MCIRDRSGTVCAKERKAAEGTERRGTEAKEKGKKREDCLLYTSYPLCDIPSIEVQTDLAEHESSGCSKPYLQSLSHEQEP